MIQIYLCQSGPTLELRSYQCQTTTSLMLMDNRGQEGTRQHSYSEVNPLVKTVLSGNGKCFKGNVTPTVGRIGAVLDKKVKVMWELRPACVMRSGSCEELGKDQSRQTSYGLVAYFILHLLYKSVKSTRSATFLANSLL